MRRSAIGMSKRRTVLQIWDILLEIFPMCCQTPISSLQWHHNGTQGSANNNFTSHHQNPVNSIISYWEPQDSPKTVMDDETLLRQDKDTVAANNFGQEISTHHENSSQKAKSTPYPTAPSKLDTKPSVIYGLGRQVLQGQKNKETRQGKN
uniref:Uncharacterized protein n=1 Tax=Romanomermis culicivorax TaxID=13658 RepID=A0A915KHB0_ROMCU